MSQVNDHYETKDSRMTRYLSLVKELAIKLQAFEITQVPRNENELADSITDFASAGLTYSYNIGLEILGRPFVFLAVAAMVQVSDITSWATPILCYLKDKHLLEYKKEEYKVKKRSTRYTLINRELYKRMYTDPYLRCLEPHQVGRVINEIHEGTCGSYIGGWNLADIIRTQGYLWPTLRKDVEVYTKACDTCQRFIDVIYVPTKGLNPTTSPWSFSIWTIDIVESLSLASAQKKFLLVVTDYFTKWPKAKTFAQIKAHQLIKLVWQNIVFQF